MENVALVWQVMSVLEKKLNINFRNCAIEKGLNNAKMIGRLDVDQDNMIIRDGAHNISAVQALIDTLKTWHLKVKPILILGILSDKNYNEMIEILLPHFELIIAVKPNNFRALSSDELITVIKKSRILFLLSKSALRKLWHLLKKIVLLNNILL
ncbi:glutamate ligase domain-containing protein [Leuconostoc palmae]|uniref:glutamate ligase domain-containing protein n=1 Tax=Leuconostoc palmae TaxID=501487 RepID=UPI001FE8973F|nr:cyanophycin synthetase [Leuconostoc palmae]